MYLNVGSDGNITLVDARLISTYNVFKSSEEGFYLGENVGLISTYNVFK